MNCATVDRYLDAFVDGEVDASAGMEVERHLSACGACAERLKFAAWLKRGLQQSPREVPAGLRERIEGSLAAEREQGWGVRLDTSWRATAAAAALALCVFGLGSAVDRNGQGLASAGVAPIFEDVVRAHVRTYPTEVAEREQVPAYFQQRVGFAVRPVDFHDPGVRFVGARDIEVGGRHAATLQYEMNGRRMTVVAFKLPAHLSTIGNEVEAGGQRVRYVSVRGHVVPIVEQGGVVYAVMSDLSPEDRLMMAARASLR